MGRTVTIAREFRIVVTCQRCGADVDYVAGGNRWSWQQAAVVRCTECRWQGVLNVTVATAGNGDKARDEHRIDAQRGEAERAADRATALAAARRRRYAAKRKDAVP